MITDDCCQTESICVNVCLESCAANKTFSFGGFFSPNVSVSLIYFFSPLIFCPLSLHYFIAVTSIVWKGAFASTSGAMPIIVNRPTQRAREAGTLYMQSSEAHW